MLYQVVAGKKSLSDKAVHRLQLAEEAAGLLAPHPAPGETLAEGVHHLENLVREESAACGKQSARVCTALKTLRAALDELERALEERS
jgi:hypothetical protein